MIPEAKRVKDVLAEGFDGALVGSMVLWALDTGADVLACQHPISPVSDMSDFHNSVTGFDSTPRRLSFGWFGGVGSQKPQSPAPAEAASGLDSNANLFGWSNMGSLDPFALSDVESPNPFDSSDTGSVKGVKAEDSHDDVICVSSTIPGRQPAAVYTATPTPIDLCSSDNDMDFADDNRKGAAGPHMPLLKAEVGRSTSMLSAVSVRIDGSGPGTKLFFATGNEAQELQCVGSDGSLTNESIASILTAAADGQRDPAILGSPVCTSVQIRNRFLEGQWPPSLLGVSGKWAGVQSLQLTHLVTDPG